MGIGVAVPRAERRDDQPSAVALRRRHDRLARLLRVADLDPQPLRIEGGQLVAVSGPRGLVKCVLRSPSACAFAFISSTKFATVLLTCSAMAMAASLPDGKSRP